MKNKRNGRPRINRRGESLVTALIAMVVLSVVMLGLAEVFIRTMKNNGSAGGVTDLMNAAQETADTIMLLPDTGMTATGWTEAKNTYPSILYDANRYTVQYRISNFSIFSGDNSTSKVEVEAKYTPQFASVMGIDAAGSLVRICYLRPRS